MSCTLSAQVPAGRSASLPAEVDGGLESAHDLIRLAHAAIIDGVGGLAELVPAPVERATSELLPELDRIAADLSAASRLAGEPAGEQEYLDFELYLNQPVPVDVPVQLALGGGEAGHLGVPQVSFDAGRHWQQLPGLMLPAGTASARVRIPLVLDPSIDGAQSESSIAATTSGATAPGQPLHTGLDLGIVGRMVRRAGSSPAGFVGRDELPGCYGQFSVDAEGAWAYSLNHAVPEVRALQRGHSLTECFEVLDSDGTPHDVLITLFGGDDALLIYGIEIHLPTLRAD
ncbi:MAG: VCBS domain-containing protein [Leptothrix sp. (in: b-proteobacteria)]